MRTMRRARIKVKGEGVYHVVSRIGGRRFLIDDTEKGILLGRIRAAAAFSGVEVYTYALMDNHFHLLIRVPERVDVPEEELRRRMLALYGPERAAKVFALWEKWEAKGNGGRVEDEKRRLRARMYDLSQFVKTFKESYTQDYNRRHDNTGTIWEGRFKSILVEGAYRALMTVAGYIHLNPVRAEVVEAPEQARNTGYGAACAGDALALRGVESLAARAFGCKSMGWDAAREACREAMDGALSEEERFADPGVDVYTRGETGAEPGAPGGAGRTGDGAVRELLRHRCVGFLHGGAVGRKAFRQALDRLLPERRRQRPEGILDRCRGLGLAPVLGVREAS